MSWSEAVYTIDEVSKKISKKKDSGIPPTNIIGLVFENVFEDIDFIRVSNIYVPKDTVVDKIRLCRVAGVAVIIKETEYPIDEGDGKRVADILVDGTIKIYDNRVQIEKNDTTDKYTLSFIPGKYDSVWWIGFYSYSDHNVYNRNYNNVNYLKFGYDQDKIPDPELPGSYQEISGYWAFDQDFTNLDPDASITYPEGFINSNYTPSTAGNYNDWDDFVNNVLENKPYVIQDNSSGIAIAPIDPNNTNQLVDGSNALNYGSHFAWLNTMWIKEEYTSDGNSRRVTFTDHEEEGFTPMGFINKQRQVMKGVWIPMYYTGTNALANPNTHNTSSKTGLSNLLAYAKNVYGTSFAPMPIMNMIRDLLFMICKSTNVAKAAYPDNNFILYSKVLRGLGWHFSEFPYCSAGNRFNSGIYDSDDYGGTVSTLDGVGQYYGVDTGYWASKLKYMGPTFGSYLIPDGAGSSTTGLTESNTRFRYAKALVGSTYADLTAESLISCERGGPFNNLYRGTRANTYVFGDGQTRVASMVLPAIDYKPSEALSG